MGNLYILRYYIYSGNKGTYCTLIPLGEPWVTYIYCGTIYTLATRVHNACSYIPLGEPWVTYIYCGTIYTLATRVRIARSYLWVSHG